MLCKLVVYLYQLSSDGKINRHCGEGRGGVGKRAGGGRRGGRKEVSTDLNFFVNRESTSRP